MWWLMAAGMAMQLGGSIMQGRMAVDAAKLENYQHRENARRTRIASQQVASEYMRDSKMLQSRARAVAAASGTSGEQVDQIIDDIGAEGEYRALMALYNGETTSKQQEYAGQAAMFQAESQKKAGYIGAGGSIMSSASSQWDRY